MDIKIISQFGENIFNLNPEDAMKLINTAFQLATSSMRSIPAGPVEAVADSISEAPTREESGECANRLTKAGFTKTKEPE